MGLRRILRARLTPIGAFVGFALIWSVWNRLVLYLTWARSLTAGLAAGAAGAVIVRVSQEVSRRRPNWFRWQVRVLLTAFALCLLALLIFGMTS